MSAYIDLLGRVLMGSYFGLQAYDAVVHPKATKLLMAEYGMTWNPDLLLWAGSVLLVLGSLLLILGYRSKFAAVLLLLYWVPVTLAVHPVWRLSGEALRSANLGLWQDLALAGGLLLIVAHGTGRFAVRKLFATARVS